MAKTKHLRSYRGPRRGPKRRQERSLGPAADALIAQCREARLAAGKSQEDVALEMGGVDRSNVAKVETKVHGMVFPRFLLYAKACGLTVLLVPTEEVDG